MCRWSFLFFIACVILVSCKEDVADNITNNVVNNYTFDESDIFEKTNGPYYTYIYNFLARGNDLYAYTPTCIWHSQDTGKSWSKIEYLTPSDYPSSILISDDKEIFAYGLLLSNLYSTTDNGTTWATKKINIDSVSNISLLGLGANNSIIIKALQDGYYELYSSQDKGDSWTKLAKTSLPFIKNYYYDKVNNTMFIYDQLQGMDGNQDIIMASTDNGNTWSEMYKRSNDRYNNNLAFTIDKKGNYYVATGPVMKSTDKGITWERKINGLYMFSINDVEVSSNDVIYLLSSRGIYKSGDGGESWQLFFKSDEITGITIDQNDYLFVVTDFGAIYRTKNKVD